MSTTRSTIREWLEAARADGCTHIAVMYDSFDHEDYPVMVQTPAEYAERVTNSDDRVMEVYDLGRDLEAQLAEDRAYHPPAPARVARATPANKPLSALVHEPHPWRYSVEGELTHEETLHPRAPAAPDRALPDRRTPALGAVRVLRLGRQGP